MRKVIRWSVYRGRPYDYDGKHSGGVGRANTTRWI